MTTAMATESDTKFRLDSCSPRELVDALVDARGETEASRILKEASELLTTSEPTTANDATVVVSPEDKWTTGCQGLEDDEDSSENNEKQLGKSLLSEAIETSFLSPRMGKFSLRLHEKGLVATKLNDPSVRFVLLREDGGPAAAENDTGGPCNVSHVLSFPKPEDCKAIVYNRKIDEESKPKKFGGNLVVLRLNSPLRIPKQKSPTLQLCFALPADKKLGRPTGPSLAEGVASFRSNTGTEDTKDPTEAWGRLLHGALGGRFAQVLRQGVGDFKSHQHPNTSTTTAGMPFVSCYLGVNDGVLYPLEEGLLFYKPPRFLPRSSLHSIACGRGGGGGDSSSRYVDMVVQCSSSSNDKSNDSGEDEGGGEQTETVEFTNIQREENSVLNTYIHGVLIPAMKDDAKKHNDSGGGDDEDSDEVVAEAIAEEDIEGDAMEDDDEPVEAVQEGESHDEDDSDDDEYFEEDDDADERGDGSDGEDDDSSVDDLVYGEDDEGIAVVRDEFAQELVNEKRRKRDEESATESEDDDSSSGGPRLSKRLRRTGA
mmetsp:Transcript_55106/g.112519  ORF Transcript_55106/g.112519 Transcript_55106/m.112519 type:complete len:542 (-) Transcript_55106:1105-2730(-)